MYIHRDIHTYRQNVMGRGTSKIKRGARGTVALKKPLLHALFVISHKPGRTDYIYIYILKKTKDTYIYMCIFQWRVSESHETGQLVDRLGAPGSVPGAPGPGLGAPGRSGNSQTEPVSSRTWSGTSRAGWHQPPTFYIYIYI